MRRDHLNQPAGIFREQVATRGIERQDANERVARQQGHAHRAQQRRRGLHCAIAEIERGIRVDDGLPVRREPACEALAGTDARRAQRVRRRPERLGRNELPAHRVGDVPNAGRRRQDVPKEIRREGENVAQRDLPRR